MANGVTYLNASTDLGKDCKDLGKVFGRPNSIWGGKMGNSQARIDALEQAARAKATHFLETDANWADGNVTGVAYRCDRAS